MEFLKYVVKPAGHWISFTVLILLNDQCASAYIADAEALDVFKKTQKRITQR
jgi:hypothetical protein